jgi:hypothetical protein
VLFGEIVFFGADHIVDNFSIHLLCGSKVNVVVVRLVSPRVDEAHCVNLESVLVGEGMAVDHRKLEKGSLLNQELPLIFLLLDDHLLLLVQNHELHFFFLFQRPLLLFARQLILN